MIIYFFGIISTVTSTVTCFIYIFFKSITSERPLRTPVKFKRWFFLITFEVNWKLHTQRVLVLIHGIVEQQQFSPLIYHMKIIYLSRNFVVKWLSWFLQPLRYHPMYVISVSIMARDLWSYEMVGNTMPVINIIEYFHLFIYSIAFFIVAIMRVGHYRSSVRSFVIINKINYSIL